jgi:hypothetical protein
MDNDIEVMAEAKAERGNHEKESEQKTDWRILM